MNMITNNLATAELQRLDAAHHFHPFTDKAELAKKGARVILRGEGVWLTDSEGHRILDGMAGLWCVNIGYGRKELGQVAARQIEELPYYKTFFQTTHVPAIALAAMVLGQTAGCARSNRYDGLKALPHEEVKSVVARHGGDHTPRVGIAFGGGGVRGFVHLGVLRAFEEAGIRADVVAGTSVGALATTLYASGLSDFVADASGISKRYLHELFGDTNQTVSQFIRDERLIAAIDLIASSPTLSMAEISYRFGFCDQAQFSRLFKAKFDQAPSEWRKHGSAANAAA